MEQKERNMRFAISGATGSGKTTLAKDLAERLRLPVLSENWAPLMLAKERYFSTIKDESSGTDQRRETLHNWKLAYKKWLDTRHEEQFKLKGYVSDRWAADAYSNWLREFMSSPDDSMALYLLRAMRVHSEMFDFFVILPVTQKIAEDRNTEDLKREPSLHIRVMANGLTAGLITHYLKRPIIEVPSRSMSREARVDYVLDRSSLDK